MPLAPKDVQQLYQLNWGKFCALTRSDSVTIFTFLDLYHAWVLIVYLLLDRAGYQLKIVSNAPVEERIGGRNVLKKQYTEVEYVAMKTK